MKPLLITSMLAFAAPVASANDFVDFHKKLFRVHRDVHRTIHKAVVHPSVHVTVGHRHRDRHGARRRNHRVWVPVRYETVRRRVYVPGRFERVWHPAEYESRRDRCGYRYRVLVSRGHYDTVRTNGRYEWRRERVRRGGYYRTVDSPHHNRRHRR